MEKVISVIIPVYNVEKYISQCLESIIIQSYHNLEIILIDDGSTDNSGKICDDYAKKDNRIKVVHQSNGGAANAKNAGLRVATGEYLSFVDSDDYLETDAYQYMIAELTKNKADIIQCSFQDIYKDRIENQVKLEEFCTFETQEYLKRFTLDWTCGLLWDKLYKRGLFEGIFFEEGHKIDDEFFTYQGIMNAKKIIHSPKVIYNYRKRKSSVMFSENPQKKILLDKLDYLEKRRIKITKRFPELKYDFDYHYLNMLLILSRDFSTDVESLGKIKSLIANYFNSRQCIKMKIRFWIKLKKIQYSGIGKLMKNKECKTTMANQNEYFE